jgi:hypothetical protein
MFGFNDNELQFHGFSGLFLIKSKYDCAIIAYIKLYTPIFIFFNFSIAKIEKYIYMTILFLK